MSEDVAALVLKVDGARRVRTPRRKQEEIVAAYEASGMTGAGFAASCGVKYSTLMKWVARHGRRKLPVAAGCCGGRWVEAVMEREDQGDDMGLAVEIGPSVRLRVVNLRQAELAGEVLRALGVAGRC